MTVAINLNSTSSNLKLGQFRVHDKQGLFDPSQAQK